MTWNEFKKYVDECLKEFGISGNSQVFEINVVFPSNRKEACPIVEIDEDNGIMIRG